MRKLCRFNPRNLQHEFSSHAPDFGVSGNWSKANADLFKQAIETHAAAASVVISGTFRGVVLVTHYYDPTNELWVAIDRSNMFKAGWKLYPSQILDLLTKGDVT